jgi:hypothetical protein
MDQGEIETNNNKVTREVSPHFSPGSGILGQAGKAGWTIGRRGIVILHRLSMYQGRSFKMRSQLVPKNRIGLSIMQHHQLVSPKILDFIHFPIDNVRLVRNAG